MSVWWWVVAGLAAWFAVAVPAALVIGPVLRRCSRAREELDPAPGMRGCCRSWPGQGHQGTCRFSVMNTGEWNP